MFADPFSRFAAVIANPFSCVARIAPCWIFCVVVIKPFAATNACVCSVQSDTEAVKLFCGFLWQSLLCGDVAFTAV